MTYTIKPCPDACETEHVAPHMIRRRIDELSGRNIGSYIIAQLAKRPDKEYIYVAANRDAPAVEAFGVRGFVVGRAR